VEAFSSHLLIIIAEYGSKYYRAETFNIIHVF